MGFNLKRAVTGVATGGNSEWGANGNLWGGGGTTTQAQVPLETPEQRQARQLLLNYARTGTIGNVTAGEDIGLAPGDYGMSGLETGGLSELQKLLHSANGYGAADMATNDLLNTTPEGLDKMFSPFSAIADREGLNAEAAAKRGAAFTGNLYSTDTVRNIGDVHAKTAESKMSELARLTDAALNRKVSAIGLSQNSAQGQESIARNRIADAMAVGQLQRNLNNQRITEANNEKLRRRNETLQQLNGATSVSGSPVQFGVPEVTTQNPNPYLDFLKIAAQFGGMRLGGAGTATSPTGPQTFGYPPLPNGYPPYNSGNPLSLY